MEQGIKFTITGDTKGLETATKIAEDRISRVNSALQKNSIQAQKNARQVDLLNKAYSDGRIDTERYERGLAQITLQEDKQQAESKQLRRELSNLNREYRELGGSSRNITTSSVAAGKSLNNLGKASSVNATPALQEFSRVIQDAPFGIIGVGNNIQQLVANFGNLSLSAGGTVAALRAMLGAISGPGGILLAVSAATTLLTVFSDELFSSANAAEKLQEEIDGTNELFESELAINQELEKSIELQGKSTVGILGTRKELINNQIESLGLLIQQQQELLNIQILENQTVSNWEALVGLFNQTVNGILGAGKAMTFLSIEAAKTSKLATTLLAPLLVGAETLKESSNAQAANNEDLAKQRELQIKVNELIARQLELQNQIKETNNEINEQLQNQIRPVQIPLELDTSGVKSISGENITGSLDGLFQRPTEQTNAFIQKLQQAQNQASIINRSIGSSFNALSNTLASSLETGNTVLDAFVGTLIQSLGQMLSALAQAAIQQIAIDQAAATSSAIKGGAAAGAATGPGAIFSTPAFIAALVGVVGAAFAAIGGFAQGGVVGGGSFTGDQILARLNSGERVLTLQDQSLLTRFLRGETMGSMNQTGGLPTLEASAVIRGSDIYLAWNRAERNNKRYFGR